MPGDPLAAGAGGRKRRRRVVAAVQVGLTPWPRGPAQRSAATAAPETTSRDKRRAPPETLGQGTLKIDHMAEGWASQPSLGKVLLLPQLPSTAPDLSLSTMRSPWPFRSRVG